MTKMTMKTVRMMMTGSRKRSKRSRLACSDHNNNSYDANYNVAANAVFDVK